MLFHLRLRRTSDDKLFVLWFWTSVVVTYVSMRAPSKVQISFSREILNWFYVMELFIDKEHQDGRVFDEEIL